MSIGAIKGTGYRRSLYVFLDFSLVFHSLKKRLLLQKSVTFKN